MLTKNQYQKQRQKLIEIDSSYDPATDIWKEAHAKLEELDNTWMKQKRHIIVTDIQLPGLGDLEADSDFLGEPFCCKEHVAAAFVCCGHMYYLANERITDIATKSGYLPATLELRLVITMANAEKWGFAQGDEFTMEGHDFRMISDNKAIMKHGFRDVPSWSRTSALYSMVGNFVVHDITNPEVGATFEYQPLLR